MLPGHILVRLRPPRLHVMGVNINDVQPKEFEQVVLTSVEQKKVCVVEVKRNFKT